VLAEVEDQQQGYCGNRYDGLIILPPGEQAFQRFNDLAQEAKYEVDFTTMIWDENGTGPEDSAGRIFLQGIKELHGKVQANLAGYPPEGVRVRILVGLKNYPLERPWSQHAYEDQRVRIMEDMAALQIPSTDPKWHVEVAVYRLGLVNGTHSHAKLMIVDGKTVIAGGYNMQYAYMNGGTRRDMGIEVSGPITFNTLQAFDELWAEALSCIQFDEQTRQCTQPSIVSTSHHESLTIPHPPLGNDVVFSLFRTAVIDQQTSDNAIAAAIEAADDNINILQKWFVNTSFWNPPQYVTALLNVVQNEYAPFHVRILVSGGLPEDLPVNIAGICMLEAQFLYNDVALAPLEARRSNENTLIHTKALSIDDSFVIVGSQNFDPSAWGVDASDWPWGNLAEYSLGVDGTIAATTFNEEFNSEWNDSKPIGCLNSAITDTSLQDTTNQASPGSAIFIPAGVYTGSVTINKPLVLIGAGPSQSIIQPEGNQPAFRITSSDVVISNMKISGGDGYGIELIDSSPSSLKNIQINRVVFENNAQGGILAQGLISGSPMDYAIENNTFIGGEDGITINMLETQIETSFIRNNIFSGQSNAPIHVLSSNDSRVEYSYNLFDDCGLGVCTTNWIQGNMNTFSSAHDNLFDLAPLFASPENGAYQLSTGSPAIDAGDPELFHDFFYDGDDDGLAQIDMGAFEYAPIENVAPVVTAGTDQSIEVGSPVTITATYTDADNTENHSARIDWGDGIVEDVPVTMTGPGAGEVTGEYTYSNTGNYIVEICLTDLYGSVGCDTLNVEVTTSFPSTPVLDSFNRADGGIGSAWSGNTADYHIASNQLSVDYNGSNNDIYWKNEPFGADQEAYVTFTQVDPAGDEQALLLKSQSNITWGDGVLEVVYDALNNRAQVVTWNWPQGWVQHGADIPVTFADGDTLGARAFADGTVEVYKNGTLLATRDITSWAHYADGGYVGLWFIGADGAVLDNFGGGTISGGQQAMMAGGASSSPERTVTSAQLNTTVNSGTQFWQGIPTGKN